MNVQEELRINGYQPTVGYPGTDMGDFFKGLMDMKDVSDGLNSVLKNG